MGNSIHSVRGAKNEGGAIVGDAVGVWLYICLIKTYFNFYLLLTYVTKLRG